MEFNKFRRMLIEMVNKKLDKEDSAEEYDVAGTNGIKKHAIHLKNQKRHIGSICYLDSFYDAFLEGEMTMDDIVAYLLQMAENDMIASVLEEEISWTTDWEKMKEFVYARLVNTEKNREFLKTRPHEEILDMSIIFHLELRNENNISTGISITYDLMNIWGQTKDSLLKQALANAKKEEFYLADVRSVIENGGEIDRNTCMERKPKAKKEMYLLTGRKLQYRAALILLPEVRKRLRDFFEEGVYILPSSVHELLLVPCRMIDNVKILRDMLRFENATTLEPEEFLSENIYELDEEGNLAIAG